MEKKTLKQQEFIENQGYCRDMHPKNNSHVSQQSFLIERVGVSLWTAFYFCT